MASAPTKAEHRAASPFGAASLDAVRAFRADPLGPHGPELARIVSLLRCGDVAGKYCLICVKPHAEWMIGRMSGQRGVPPVIDGNRVFTSLEAAEWAVFKLRWQAACGTAIDEDAL